MSVLEDLIVAIELHSVESIRSAFEKGVNPNDEFRGEPLIYELTSEYTRTPRFKECVRAFVDFGLEIEDKILLAVLLDDAVKLGEMVSRNSEAVWKTYSLRCAYTPLFKASLLHICAEFNHVSCARVWVENGADVNAVAGIDENGFGGQTPIFHTVNQNSNNSFEMFEFLLEKSAEIRIAVPGLIWGKGYEWETLIPAVNPISYAMMGLLPQMHRDEKQISEIVSRLLKYDFGINYSPRNVPNAYLNK
jgi:hypothetical protein